MVVATDDKRETSLLGTGGLHSIACAVYVVGFLHVLYRACVEAYNIRLYAIKEYGPIIHEFDPYFNYRATEVSTSTLENGNPSIAVGCRALLFTHNTQKDRKTENGNRRNMPTG